MSEIEEEKNNSSKMLDIHSEKLGEYSQEALIVRKILTKIQIKKFFDGMSLKPDFSWKQILQRIPMMDNIINEHLLVSKNNSHMRELYAL